MGRRLGILGMDGDLFRLIGKQESQPYIFQSQISYVYIFFLGYILTIHELELTWKFCLFECVLKFGRVFCCLNFPTQIVDDFKVGESFVNAPMVINRDRCNTVIHNEERLYISEAR